MILFPRKYYLTLIVLSLVLLLPSCAIHAKFPYICFYSACVKGQLGIDRLPGIKKQIKARAKVKKRKAMAKNRKKSKIEDGRKEPYSDPRDEISITAKDSTTHKTNEIYSFRKDANLNMIKIIIEKPPAPNDSLIYFYIDDKNDISEEDKKNAANYLRLTGVQNISKITIRDLLKETEKGKHEKNILRYRTKKIIEFLNDQGIPESIIYAVD
jgi:hypothetical protein